METLEKPVEIGVNPISQKLSDEIQLRFTYHSPFGDQPVKYGLLRDSARLLALQICRLSPESREQALALTNLEQAIFWANAAIARREENPAQVVTT